jgi:hypothetical protein
VAAIATPRVYGSKGRGRGWSTASLCRLEVAPNDVSNSVSSRFVTHPLTVHGGQQA